MHPFAARDVDSRASVLLHSDVDFRWFWNHRFVWSARIKPVNTSLDTNPVTACGQVI